MEDTKKRIGRPRTRVEDGPGAYVGFRASHSLKEQLEHAAAVNGRSISSEAQFRLERSFSAPPPLSEVTKQAYGDQATEFFNILWEQIRYEIRQSHQDFRGDWINNPTCFKRVDEAIRRTLEWVKPEGEPKELRLESPSNAVDRYFIMVADYTRAPRSGWFKRWLPIFGEAFCWTLRRRKHELVPSTWDDPTAPLFAPEPDQPASSPPGAKA